MRTKPTVFHSLFTNSAGLRIVTWDAFWGDEELTQTHTFRQKNHMQMYSMSFQKNEFPSHTIAP